jgi:hypothetical protein
MIDRATAAFSCTLRALPLPSIGGIVLLVVAPTLVTVMRSGDDLMLASTAAAVVGGSGLAYAVDDDAAVVLAASPIPLVVRRAIRILAATALVAIGWTLVVVAGWSTDLLAGLPTADLAVETVTAAGVGVAAAGWITRDGTPDRAGLAGTTTGVVLMLVITSLAMRYPWLPALGQPQNHARWWWVAGAAWVIAWWTARDPAARLGSSSAV